MKYISIGAVMTEGTEHCVTVCRGSNRFPLSGELAAVWLSGRLGFTETQEQSELQALEQLVRMGLAVKSQGYAIADYRALTQCTIVPADRKHPFLTLSSIERAVLQWIREAGLVLSMAELVYLMDRNVPLNPEYLGSDNTQRLVERIYTKDTIFDNILENQMERTSMRDKTVNAVLSLLRKKRIVLL